jgi:5-formyltetrahydrofolate cyclo-ligase
MGETERLHKVALRKRLVVEREQMPQEQRRAAEKKIADVLSARAVLQGWQRVAVFLPWRGEPDLMATWRAWHGRGLVLALPVVVAQGQPLVMQQWRPGAPLIQDAMGLSVPQKTPSLMCDTWLVPCVGIDPQGRRLGAGKGFYDRTIAATQTPWPRLIGVCFGHALQAENFGEPHDLLLDACVTEQGWRPFRAEAPQ